MITECLCLLTVVVLFSVYSITEFYNANLDVCIVMFFLARNFLRMFLGFFSKIYILT